MSPRTLINVLSVRDFTAADLNRAASEIDGRAAEHSVLIRTENEGYETQVLLDRFRYAVTRDTKQLRGLAESLEARGDSTLDSASAREQAAVAMILAMWGLAFATTTI